MQDKKDGKEVADHPNKHIRKALSYAEQQGWMIRKSSGHAIHELELHK